jgi:hypothetical protein
MRGRLGLSTTLVTSAPGNRVFSTSIIPGVRRDVAMVSARVRADQSPVATTSVWRIPGAVGDDAVKVRAVEEDGRHPASREPSLDVVLIADKDGLRPENADLLQGGFEL